MNCSTPRQTDQDRKSAELLAGAARQLFALGRADLAHPVAILAREADPLFGNAHSVVAGVLDSMGQFEDALESWSEAAHLMPDSQQQRVNLALALLAEGHWERGLPLYEARLATEQWSSIAVRGSLPAIRHRLARPDTLLHGKRMLVISEQGLGDAIWSARFLAPMAARCAELTVATSAALRPLINMVTGPARVMAPPEDLPNTRINLLAPDAVYDHVAPMMSLPWLLGIRPGDLQFTRTPYLKADLASVRQWRARYCAAFPDARLIVGLIWQTNPTGPASAERSIQAAAFSALSSLDGIGFVNLQGGNAMERVAISTALPQVMDPLAETGGRPPLNRYAAAVAATDLLVSVDTMGAHLAGAMAHPGIVLLPTAPSFGFFWGNQGSRTPWYQSLHLVRQTHHRSWREPLTTLFTTLNGWPGGAK